MSKISASSQSDVIVAVRQARATRSPFEIMGAGSKRALGRTMKRTIDVLDVSLIKGIIAYEPEELIITVLPGTPVREIEAALSAKGQRLGFDPPDWGPLLGAEPLVGTIGGAICTDASGPARVQYGAVRDQLLGFSAVNGLGEAFKAGGKVVKNVTGFDIPKLICGAFGTLCVLTEVTLRVFPKPSRSQTFFVRDLAPKEGLALLRSVWTSPLEATGLAYASGCAFIRLEAEDEPLAEKIAMLKTLSAARQLHLAEDSVFRGIANGDAFVGTLDNIWRVAIPPSQAHFVVEQVGSKLWYADCAGGLLWIASNDHERIRDVVKIASGHAILFRADAEARSRIAVFEIEDPVRAQLTRSIKAAFDPLTLFNPNRMWNAV